MKKNKKSGFTRTLTLQDRKKLVSGFTLLELIIVIAIIAILSVALVLVLNPAEVLKKARDAQRISDLSTLKTAIGLYMTNTTAPLLDNVTNAMCKTPLATTARGAAGAMKIWYSTSSTSAITDISLDGSTVVTPAVQVVAANLGLTGGTGWLPVNFDGLTGGSPISNEPIDPVNVVAAGHLAAGVDNTDLVYRYSCFKDVLSFEIDAVLESIAYVTTDPKMTNDGGNNTAYYEVGTNLQIFAAGLDF